MTLRPILLTSLLALLVTSLLWQGHRILARQRVELESWEKRGEQLEKQISAQRLANETTARDLAAAERQLEELPDSSSPATTETERIREIEIGGWLKRVRRLKRAFEEHPEQKIPEMRLLDDEDWLRVSRSSDLEGDEKMRAAMAAVRNAAKIRLASPMSDTFSQYTKTFGPAPPSNTAALLPYLKSPIDAEILARYEIALDDAAPGKRPPWMIQEKAPVDPDYDSRYMFYPNLGTVLYKGAIGWIPDIRARYLRANEAYAAANHGTSPASPAALIPYFDPPLDPVVAEKVRQAARQQTEKK